MAFFRRILHGSSSQDTSLPPQELSESLADSLGEKMEELKKLSEYLKLRFLSVDLRPSPLFTERFNLWLQAVDQMEIEVIQIQDKAARFLMTDPNNSKSTRKIVAMISQKIEDVSQLSGRPNIELADIIPRLPNEMRVKEILALDVTAEKVWILINEDPEFGKIRLYGPGGVGKTNLLKKLYNMFLHRTHAFDFVFFVSVSNRDATTLQNGIMKQLGLADQGSINVKRFEILNAMGGKRFVLLLDDGNEDLFYLQTVIGIPTNKSKVVFTSEISFPYLTKSYAEIEIEGLKKDDALGLFLENVGEVTLTSHPKIPKLAEDVARECLRLPLFLITVGRAMAGKKTVPEWDIALKKLRTLGPLDFIYDSLSNDTLKACFIYCALFPVEDDISIEELVDLWIAEGYLNVFSDRGEALTQGLQIIQDLKLAYLLENGESENHVRMHCLFHDAMAKRVAPRLETSTLKQFYVDELDNDEIDWPCDHSDWYYNPLDWCCLYDHLDSSYRRILIPGGDYKLSGTLRVNHLVSLFVRDSKLKALPDGFVDRMPHIKVLSLSHNAALERLPKDIGELVYLRYLNLSHTRIKVLPTSIKKLKKLEYLGLGDTTRLAFAPLLLTHFHVLKVLDMWNCGKSPDDVGEVFHVLEDMKTLFSVKITIDGTFQFQAFMACPRLQSITRRIMMKESKLVEVDKRPDALEVNSLSTLEKFTSAIPQFNPGQNFQSNLHSVTICGFPQFYHLTWLIGFSNLCFLSIFNCHSMEEVIQGEDAGSHQNVNIFSRLEFLQLFDVPNLRSIYNKPLPFPCLKEIQIFQCSNLKKLPLDSNSAKNSIEHIVVSPHWWNDLEWEDEAIEHVFFPRVTRFRFGPNTNGSIFKQYCYDRLSYRLQTCFIYCFLFPVDYSIKIEELVNLWIVEGFLGELGHADAVNQGLQIVQDLKLESLLESVKFEDCVQMQDMLRDMAFWIVMGNSFVVKSLGIQLVTDHEARRWQNAQRISLSEVKNIQVASILRFPKLSSFFYRGDSSNETEVVLPGEFFQFMPVLKVLDLSHNPSLTHLPREIGDLVSLQYLNLSCTGIKELPTWITNFSRLEYLVLDHTDDIQIKQGVLGSLSMLQVLYMWHVDVYEGFLDELENLQHLASSKLTLDNDHDIQKFQSSHKLQKITRTLQIKQFNNSSPSFIMNQCAHLEVLELFHCGHLKDLAFNIPKSFGYQSCLPKLHTVNISTCDELQHLTWLASAPNLRSLTITNCESVEEVVHDESGAAEWQQHHNIFARLELMHLSYLPELWSIYDQPLLFPCLKEIHVYKCPKLKKLPVDSKSARNGFESIETDMVEDTLEWEDEATRLVFAPYILRH